MLLTAAESPVDHERAVQSKKNPQALKPRVIESPSEAIDDGPAAEADAAGSAATTTARTVAVRRTAWQTCKGNSSGGMAEPAHPGPGTAVCRDTTGVNRPCHSDIR